MIKKEEVISFVWQHILLLVSLYVMTFGVAACVRSQLGSSVISGMRHLAFFALYLSMPYTMNATALMARR